MGFGDFLGSVFDASKDAAGDALGTVMDTAKAGFNAEEKAKAQFLSDHKTIHAIYNAGTGALDGGLQALNFEYTYGLARPASTVLQQMANVHGNDASNLFSPSAWSKAYKNSAKVSPGQAFVQEFAHGEDAISGATPGQGNFSQSLGIQHTGPVDWMKLASMGDKSSDHFSAQFSLASGAADAAIAWYADPLVVGGKALKAGREARNTITEADKAALAGEVAKPTARQQKVVTKAQNLFSATDNKTASQIAQLKTFKQSTNGTALASLFAQASGDHATKSLILRTALGDQAAYGQLAAMRKDIAGQINRMTADLDAHIALEKDALASGGKFASLNSEDFKAELRSQLESSHSVLDMLDRAVGNPDKVKAAAAGRGQVSKDEVGIFSSMSSRPGVTRGDTRKMLGVTQYTIQDGVAGIPVRVLRAPANYRPNGIVDLHDGDQTLREWDAQTKTAAMAGFDPARRQQLLDNIVNAQDDNARMLHIRHGEAEMVAHIGQRLGYSPEDTRALLDKMSTERAGLNLGGPKAVQYSSAENPETGMTWDFHVDENGVAHQRPLLETQLDNTMHLLDLNHVYRVMKRNQQAYTALKWANKSYDILEHSADLFNDMWKFGALFRGGYVLRNAVDTNMRLLAFLGAQHYARTVAENMGQSLTRRLSRGPADAEHASNVEALAAAKASLKEAKGAERTALKSKVADLQAKVEAGPQYKPAYGQGHFNAGGAYDNMPDARGITEEELQYNNRVLSASDSWANFIFGESNKLLDKYRGSGDWRTVPGYDPQYETHYLRAVNNHLRQSAITQRLLSGQTPDQVIEWLKSDAGRSLRRRMVFGNDSAEELVAANLGNLQHIIPDQSMWKTLLERPFTNKDIETQFGKLPHNRPDINAEQVAYQLGQHPVVEAYGKIRDGYFDWASKLTDDAMGRHPLYVALYRGQYRKLLKQADPGLKGTLDVVAQRTLEEQARIFARREMKRVMFDVSQKSDLAHFVRFVMPFYSAWQDALVKYGRLIARDPSQLAHGWTAWTAPNDSSFIPVVDAQTGLPIPSSKSRLTDNEVIRIPSKWARMLGVNYTLDISKASLNIALQGDPIWAPGWGPMGQIPANEIVKRTDNAQLANAFKSLGILPFGVQDQGTLSWKAMIPGVGRQLALPEARMARMKAMILIDEMHRYERGDRKTKPTAAEVNQKFLGLMALREATSSLSPFSVQFKSPYQFYIDQSHAYDQKIGKPGGYKDSSEADAAFLHDFGPDYFVFRTSMSKANVPIQSSQQADSAARRIRDLIDKHPAYAPFLIGPDNKGNYDQNVYALQGMRNIGAGMDKWRDTYSNPEQAIQKNNADLGWIEYRNLSDQLLAIQKARGLSNMLGKGAADLRAIKQQWIERNTNPETAPKWGQDWYTAYLQRNQGVARNFLLAAKDAVKDKRINSRPDIKAVGEYLAAREQMRAILKQRQAAGGSASVFAQSNQDLGDIWANITSHLMEKNLLFSNVFTRYLERDDLSQAV